MTMARKFLHIDVMDGEMYVRTLHMPYLPALNMENMVYVMKYVMH